MPKSESINFPETATSEEKRSFFLEIGRVSDSELGFSKDKDKNPKTKFTVRNIILNDQGQIGVIKSEKYDYFQVPGGCLEPGETIEQALRRETIEEMGYEVEDLRPLGYYLENRESNLNTHPWTEVVAFVYLSRALKNVGTHYMEDEIEEGFKPLWLDLYEALKHFDSQLTKILSTKTSYSGTFASCRDLALIKFYCENLKSASPTDVA